MNIFGSNNLLRLAIIDDSDIFRDGLRSVLKQVHYFDIVYDDVDGLGLLNNYHSILPDIVLMDIQMKKLDGIETTLRILQEDPTTKVIGLSMFNCVEYLEKLLGAGAKGYVLKKSGKDTIMDAIKKVYSGGVYIDKEIEMPANLRIEL